MTTSLDNVWPGHQLEHLGPPDWPGIERAVGATLDGEAKEAIQRALNNYVIACGLAAELKIIRSRSIRGSRKPSGKHRHVSPLLSFQQAMDDLFDAWNALRASNAGSVVAEYDDTGDHCGKPPLEWTIGHLSLHQVTLAMFLKDRSAKAGPSAFEALVLRLARVFERVTGRTAAASNSGNAFTVFVWEVETLAVVPRGGPMTTEYTEAFAQRVYRAQVRARQAEG